MIKPRPKGAAKVRPANPDAILLPFQERWRADRSRVKIAEKSRQIGWTWTDALSAVEACVDESCAGSGVWVSSRDELQAKLYLDDCRYWANLYQQGAEALGLTDVLDEAGGKHSAYVLRFPNGMSIFSLSSNPDAQAGKRGTRKLDEFALHADPKKLYDIAYPGITWGGTLDIFSTHRGSHNFFNRLIREVRDGTRKGVSLHRITLQDALDEGFLTKLQGRLPAGDPRQDMDEAEYFDYIRSGCTDEEAFLQEYCCVPADDASAFLDYALIDACTYAPADNLAVSAAKDGKGSIRYLGKSQLTSPHLGTGSDLQRADLYAGFDVGRHHDLSVLWLFERVAGVMATRAVIEFDRIQFSRQEEIAFPIFQFCRRVCIDASGLGMQLAERAQQRFGEHKVEAVKFSAPVKEELAYPLRKAFEDRSLRIPFDNLVTSDLRKVRKETTAAGNVRFVADSDAAGHADRFWALALALHAGKSVPSTLKAILI